MTQWRNPGEPPRPPGAPDPAGAQPSRVSSRDAQAAAGTARPVRTQWIVVGVAGAFIVTAIVLLVVVLSGGSDSPAGARTGTADAVTEKLAAAIHAGSAAQVRAVACTGAERRVLAAARPAFGASTARQGLAKIQGTVGVGQIAISDSASARSGTVGLRRVGGQWCVASFVGSG